MDPVRYGMIGFGGIAEQRIAKEGFGLDRSRFSPNPDAMLVGAFDIDTCRSTQAKNLGVEWFDSIDDLLSDERIEAVVIATNNTTHAPIARQVLSHNKHVFIEKPAGVTTEEVRQLCELASQKGLSIGVDHMMVKNTHNLYARDMIRKGALGDVKHLVLHMEFPFGGTAEEAATWRCAKPEELGGPIGDVASHCFYMAEFLTDDTIVSLQCVYIPKRLSIAVEDGAIIDFTTDKGITGTIRVAFNQPRCTLEQTIGDLGYEVYGTTGALYAKGTMFQLSGHADEAVSIGVQLVSENGSVESCSKGPVVNIYQSQISEHAQSIRLGIPLSGLGALHNVNLMMRAHESARDGGAPKVVDNTR